MENPDKDQKTEQATGKRINEARMEGRLPISQEVRTWCMMLAGFIVLLGVAPSIGQQMMRALPLFFGMADQLHVSDGGLRQALIDTFNIMMPGLGTAAAIFAAGAIIGTVAQTGWFASSQLIGVKWNRVSLIGGWKKLFNKQQLVESLKAKIKLAIVIYVLYRIMKPMLDRGDLLVGMPVELQVVVLHKVIVKLFGIALLFLTVYAAFDLWYQRKRYKEELKMTKQEVKDEHKQSEGDPIVRNRIRRMRLEKARRRMMANIPNADVIITNPTHFAVALEYKPDKMRAPRVIGKGQDAIALKIREVAQEHDVPIVENPPLARALHASCDMDDEVPVEHYQAVAEVISYVYKLKKRVKRT